MEGFRKGGGGESGGGRGERGGGGADECGMSVMSFSYSTVGVSHVFLFHVLLVEPLFKRS
jgi:hypothetical protein